MPDTLDLQRHEAEVAAEQEKARLAEQQRHEALLLANAVRQANARTLQAIRDVKMRKGLAMVIDMLEHPAYGPVAQIPVHRLLVSIRWMGPTKAQGLLFTAGILTGDRRLGQLTTRQRDELRFGLRMVLCNLRPSR